MIEPTIARRFAVLAMLCGITSDLRRRSTNISVGLLVVAAATICTASIARGQQNPAVKAGETKALPSQNAPAAHSTGANGLSVASLRQCRAVFWAYEKSLRNFKYLPLQAVPASSISRNSSWTSNHPPVARKNLRLFIQKYAFQVEQWAGGGTAYRAGLCFFDASGGQMRFIQTCGWSPEIHGNQIPSCDTSWIRD